MKKIIGSYNIHINSFTTGCIGFMFGWLEEHDYKRDACYRFEGVVGGLTMQSDVLDIKYDCDSDIYRIGSYDLSRSIDYVHESGGVSFIYVEHDTDTDSVCFIFR